MVVLGTEGRLLVQAIVDPDPDAAIGAWKGYLDRVDLQLVPWSHTRLLPTLWARMNALGADTPALVRGTYRQAWSRNLTRFHAAAATIRNLEDAGVRTVLLKGAALVPTYRGDWGARDMGDVDVLVESAELARAAAILEADGWQPALGLTMRSALARFGRTRHSWGLHAGEPLALDLHWHVLAGSRGPGSDRAFFDAAVPLELGGVRSRRLGDADQLLHTLEHASHGELHTELQWIVDAVHVLRSITEAEATAERFAERAAEHGIVAEVGECLAVIDSIVDEPTTGVLRRRLERQRRAVPPRPGTFRGRLAEHRRGGTRLPAALASLARAELDGDLALRPRAWTAYVATGRRPGVERLLTRRKGPLTITPGRPAPPPDGDGWWVLGTAAEIDAFCGPGWSWPEGQHGGVWTVGSEARLSLPVPDGAGNRVTVDVDLSLLGRHGGAPRTVALRAAGRTLTTLAASQEWARYSLSHTVPRPAHGTVELSLRIRGAARPTDLGLPYDLRRLGAMLHRVRVRS